MYNFNISNFHHSAHFTNAAFQFTSNRVTVFLNMAYDKRGAYAIQTGRPAGGGAAASVDCVYLYQGPASCFGTGDGGDGGLKIEKEKKRSMYCVIERKGSYWNRIYSFAGRNGHEEKKKIILLIS